MSVSTTIPEIQESYVTSKITIHMLSNGDIYTGLSYEYAGIVPPYNATEVDIIPHKDGFARRFVRGTQDWEYVPLEELIPPPPPEPTLEVVKAAKLAEISAAAEATLAVMTASYPQGELLTFDKQEAEARAWLVDNTAPTPLLSPLAVGRGIPLADLVEKVIAKADVFSAASGYVIGQRQGLEDRLDAAATVEEVQAIAVSLHLPAPDLGAQPEGETAA